MKAAFWGVFGTRNFGNECTLHSMLDAARRHVPNGDSVVICSQPKDASATHRVPAYRIGPNPRMGLRWTGNRRLRGLRIARELWDWVRVLRLVKGLDCLVITGTGIINDAHESPLGMPYQLFKWTLAARLCGVRVMFVSVGVDGLSHWLLRRILTLSLRLANYRSYRDPLSRVRVASFFPRAALDPVTPDLAFSLPRALVEPTKGRAEDPLGVAVGIFGVEESGEALDRYVETIGRFILRLLDQGYRPRVVIGDLEYDDRVLDRLTAWLDSERALHRVITEPINSFEDLVAQLSEASLVVATRFHNVLLSLLLGKPVISVSHMDKNDELMTAIGLGRFSIPLTDVDVDVLSDRFMELSQNAGAIRSALVEQREQYRAQLEEQYALLFRSS